MSNEKCGTFSPNGAEYVSDGRSPSGNSLQLLALKGRDMIAMGATDGESFPPGRGNTRG